LKITYTEEAIADIVEAISYLNERNSAAAAKLDTEIRALHRTPGKSRIRRASFASSLRRCDPQRGVPPFRIYYQRHPHELVIVRVYHQSRRPITR
jgi:plasmid stabilization system protein ParE